MAVDHFKRLRGKSLLVIEHFGKEMYAESILFMQQVDVLAELTEREAIIRYG